MLLIRREGVAVARKRRHLLSLFLPPRKKKYSTWSIAGDIKARQRRWVAELPASLAIPLSHHIPRKGGLRPWPELWARCASFGKAGQRTTCYPPKPGKHQVFSLPSGIPRRRVAAVCPIGVSLWQPKHYLWTAHCSMHWKPSHSVPLQRCIYSAPDC